MNGLSNSVLTVLLSWVKGIFSWGWSFLTNGGAGSFLTWLGSNWLWLTILLCLVGTVCDVAVYLLRWRPDIVWRSFLQRRQDRREKIPEDDMIDNADPAQDEPELESMDEAVYGGMGGEEPRA